MENVSTVSIEDLDKFAEKNREKISNLFKSLNLDMGRKDLKTGIFGSVSRASFVFPALHTAITNFPTRNPLAKTHKRHFSFTRLRFVVNENKLRITFFNSIF